MNTIKNYIFLVLIVSLISMCSGCASIINGTTQEVPVTVDPINATVSAVGGKITIVDEAPCTLKLKRKHNQILTISAPGYKPQTVELRSVLSGAVAGNILAGGLIGWGVDAATGADSRLVPETVEVILQPDPEVITEPGPTLDKAAALESELKRLEELLKSGQITHDEHRTLRQKVIEQY